MLFAVAGLIYLQQHAVFFSQYRQPFLIAAAVYFAYNLFSLPAIRRRPLSAFRTLFAPLFDIFIVSFAAVIDGGHASGIYFMLLVIIFGNGFRYGNALLLYTQALAIVGLIGVAIITLFNMHLDLDRTLLVWQLAGLIVIPSYIYLIEKKAERAMRGQNEAEEASFSLLDQGPLPVFTYDLDSNGQPRILYANAAISDVFRDHYTRLIGEQPDMLALLEDGEEMLEFCRRTLSPVHPSASPDHTRHKHVIYIRGRDRQDSILRLMCTTTRMRWRNKWIGVCFILDITQRETTQAKLESLHRRGYMSTLVAGLVHDFRNVLISMIGYAEVLQLDAEQQQTREQLQAIIEAGERGAAMISHLLTLDQDGEDSPFEHATGKQLKAALENILGLARLQLPAHIQLVCDVDEPLPDASCSVLEIEQMLLNLIHNATVAIREAGQIRVSIAPDPEHELSSGKHAALRIEVHDDGIGIAPEDIDNIFKPFWTSRRHEGGTGLGLAMVSRIVKQHSGHIEVESTPGRGTSFILHLPPYLARRQAVSPARIAQRPVAPGSLHILLVDDAPDVLKIHQALLQRLHHEAITAGNGQQALELFRSAAHPFDLVITDFRMPVMNGLELVEQIRKLDEHIPIIMITAFGEDELLQKVGGYGVRLLGKPVTLDRLKEAIEALRRPA